MPMTTSAPLTISRQQRRRLPERQPDPSWKAYANLTAPAYQRLHRNMERYGNRLNHAHQAALNCIVDRFTTLASGAEQGRWAFDLPCGGGKTQALIAWVAELHHQGLPYSVAVCASRVEPLCAIKAELISNGVPDEDVGLLHSYKHEPGLTVAPGQPLPSGHASMPATTDNENKRILLCTHARVQGAGGIEAFNLYKGKPRDLIIWDETLIISEHRSIDKVSIESALGWLRPRVRGTKSTALIETLAFLDEMWGIIDAEVQEQQAHRRKPVVLSLPPATDEQLALMLATIKRQGVPAAPLHELLSISQVPLRVVLVSQGGGGVITYDIVVDPALKNVAILDGSAAILELVDLDSTIQRDLSFDGRIKSYENVTVHQLRHASGRKSTEDLFDPKKTRREGRKMSQEIIEVVKAIPENEGIILFTFKARHGIDITAVLQSDFQAAGVNIEATVEDGKPRFVWLAWGQETAVSDFRYCRNVLFAGILHRDDNDLAGAIAGQQDDLTVTIEQSQVASVKRSEIASGLYQAMSRGSCRDTIDGKAGTMKVWLIHYDRTIRELLDRVLPGAVWLEWEAQHLEAVTYKIEGAAQAIVKHLHGLPERVTKMSTVAIKKAVGLTDLPVSTWKMSVTLAADQSVNWTKDGRSFVRSGSAADHGF